MESTSGTISSARLNLDVLAIACEFLTDVPDILSFALTCSALRPVANRWLLAMNPIYLADGVSVRKFHTFLFADAPSRAQHVLTLNILNPPRDGPLRPTFPGDSSLLTDILTTCPHIEHISIFLQDGSRRCTDDPRIIDAIVGIKSLCSLSIHGWSLRALDLLRSVRVPLRELGIWFSNVEVDFWSPAALESFLPRHLAPILEKLELCNFVTDIDGTQLQDHPKILTSSLPYLDMTTYPAVRSLRLGFVLQRPLLGHLQHFFPALDGSLSLGLLDDSVSEDAYLAIRAANQHAQQDEQGRPSSRAWKKLDRVVCDPRMFYVLGLRCPILHLMLDYCSPLTQLLDFSSPLTQWYTWSALRDNPVPRLKMSFALSEGCDVLNGLFSPELARVLTHLTLVLEFANDGGPGSDADLETVAHLRWEDLLKSIISGLRPLHNLTHIRLVVHSNIHDDPANPVVYSEEFVRATRGSVFDFAGTAALLACALPSLQYIFMSTSGYLAVRADPPSPRFWNAYERWHVARAWRIAPLGGDGSAREGLEGGREPMLVELHDDVAETIIRNEELVLSEVDKITLHLDED